MKKILAVVLALLKVKELPVKEGKISLDNEQKELIKKELAELGPDFLDKFEAAMNAEIENKSAQEQANKTAELLESVKQELAKEKTKSSSEIEALKKDLRETKEKVEKLASAPEDDYKPVAETTNDKGKKVMVFMPKVSHLHMVKAKEVLSGKGTIMPGATANIDVAELKSEFGTYLSQSNLRLEIMQKLMQKTETMQYMTPKQAITEWRASQAEITSVVQQFVSKWTPLGSSKFTPLTIVNRRHKINVPITPAEVIDSWIMYLYDEQLTPEQMPITTYIINQLVLPKVQEDRELRLIGKGVFEALPGGEADGDPGQATGKSMDGFCTILENEKTSGISKMNFLLDGEVITDANIVDMMNDFVDAIDPLYQGVPMNIFCSLDRYKQYKRAYQKLYPTTKNTDKTEDMIDFSQNRLVSLPSMAGKDLFFATPKNNFALLRNINDGASKIFMQTENYDVKVFAEWWEAVGFPIAEAVFAYVPDETSGSGSPS